MRYPKHILHLTPYILHLTFCIFQSNAQAPSLSCVSVNINGDVQLSWTPPSDTCGIFNSYDIYTAPSLFGPYILFVNISNFGQTTYNHIGAGADTSSVFYYIVNNSGCTSNISDTIQADNVQPGTVTIETVSVDSLTGLATISWISSSLFDVDGYIIYIANTFGGWDLIATVFGRDSTFFIYPNSNAGAESESYSIAAIDQCGNMGPIGTEHNTIYLSTSLDTSTGESTLQWNEYINWPSGVAEYNIYVNENGGPDSLLGTTTNTQFIHTGLVKTTTYCYMIRAIDGSGLKTSSSNSICDSINVIVINLQNYYPQNAIKIYPNPFSVYTLIEFENYKKEKHTLTLYNSLGQLVQQFDNISNGKIRIERDNLTNGLYFFQLRTDNEIIGNRKVIIE